MGRHRLRRTAALPVVVAGRELRLATPDTDAHRSSVLLLGRGDDLMGGSNLMEWIGFAGLIAAALISGVFAVIASTD